MAMTNTFRVLAAIVLLSIVGRAKGQISRTINVAGTGIVSAPPDLATIETAVVTTARTANEALDKNNEEFAQVLEVLKENVIEEKDVQTTFFSVDPQFSRGSGRRIIGYRVINEVVVKVRNIDILGEVLDALVRSGSNRISGISFSIADTKPLQDQARAGAINDARNSASLYATAALLNLGAIISISENPISEPGPTSLKAPEVAGRVPIATGELDISATVFMLFEISTETNITTPPPTPSVSASPSSSSTPSAELSPAPSPSSSDFSPAPSAELSAAPSPWFSEISPLLAQHPALSSRTSS